VPERIERPVPMKQIDELFEPRGPLDEKPISIERRFHIFAEEEPSVETRLERIDRGDGQPHWQVVVEIDGVRAGGRALPSRMTGKASRVGKRRISEERLAEQLMGFVPTTWALARHHANG
jgi:hypothetical protein